MKVRLYEGPADGREVEVVQPLPPVVFWQEPAEAEWTPDAPTSIVRPPIHRYELKTWRTASGRMEGRYRFVATGLGG